MNKKKLLILGSDFCTISVIKQAQKEGMYVIVTDLMKKSPSKEIADESWKISTNDIETLEKKCKEENVNAVMFGASEFNIENSRKLVQRLNLPIYCADDRPWKIARNKYEFKKICKEVGAPIAEDYFLSSELSDEELEKVVYPVVVKPVDKSGNAGMSYCYNKEELIEAYQYAKSISSNENIIVERMLHGNEYHINYIVADGEVNLLFFASSHHQSGEKANLYSIICTTPGHLRQYLDEVNESVIKMFKKVGCENGIAWVDAMRDEDGKFYLLEMGYRFGGVMLYEPYQKITKFNSIKWMLDCAMGKKHTKKDIPDELNRIYKECAASYHLFAKKDGMIQTIEGLEEIKNLPGVFVDIPKREGDDIRYHANMGLIGIYAKNMIELCNMIKKINSILKVKNVNDENMIIYFDSFDELKKEYEDGIRDFGSLV